MYKRIKHNTILKQRYFGLDSSLIYLLIPIYTITKKR